FAPPHLSAQDVVIDGLFGSGLNKPLAGGFAAVVKYINASAATVVAIDMPSGLMGEDNSYNIAANILHAGLTLTLQLPKLAFLFAENEPYVGEWMPLDIGLSPEGIEALDTDWQLTEAREIPSMLKPRGKFTHKGNYGRALLIAGSQGMAGASVLAAKACLRSGVGLLTAHVPFCNNFIVQTAVPEAMTQIDDNDLCFSSPVDTDAFQAVAIGPGLGREARTEEALLAQIDECQAPMVVDADALNLLEAHRSYLARLPKGSVLTPHPKELERLVGKCQNSYERLTRAVELAGKSGAHIVLKGAYTAVISPSGKCWFNATGNEGMAKGGSGDVLTGILLALLAQGYDTETAARLGVYVHGLAGDIAKQTRGNIGMTAGDIVTCLPAAWCLLQKQEREEE
ncbi:MAG: NAD(P)H-hydrate dehydratase, partial [Prevotellaceae bacterium]|nr:NAD(P)H-hydrate dehydratase [Prevotellaceae bacterium]